MSDSLQDQLLKAGLISKGKAKLDKQNNRKKKRRQRQQGGASDNAVATSVQAQRKAQQERDKALNREREQARARKALRVQMRQLLRGNRVNDKKAEERYNFAVDERLKSLYVTLEQRRGLMQGKLAVVLFGDSLYLVPLEVLDKARAMDAGVKVHINQPEEQAADADDPYADYHVPDDLMW